MAISAGSIPCPPYIQDEVQHRKAITNWMMRVSPFVTTDSSAFVTNNSLSAALSTLGGFIPATRFGVVADTRRMSTQLNIASGTAALTAPSASFTAGDVGKTLVMNWNDAVGSYISTILSVNSLTSVVLSDNCSRSLATVPGILTLGTDDRSAMQAAITYCQGSASGATLFVRAGWYTLGGMLSIAGTMSMIGDGWKGLRSIAGTTTLDWATSPAFGTVFYPTFLDNTASACIRVAAHNVQLKNFEIENVQPLPGTNWQYLSAPWAIKMYRAGFAAEGGDDVHVENVMLRNPTKGIRSQGCSRGHYRGIYGQPFVFGIFVSGCYDVPRFENIHFWPFYDLTPQVMSAQAVLADALTFGRVDGPILVNCFAYHMRSLVRCFNSDEVDIAVDGFTERGFGTNLYADDCQWGLFIQDNASFDITNFQIYCSTVSGSRAIYATSRIGQDSILRLSIANLDIQAPMLEAVKMEVACQLNLTNFRLRSCNLSNVSAAVIDLTRTSTCNLVNFVDENAHFSSSLFAVGSSVTLNWARGPDISATYRSTGTLQPTSGVGVELNYDPTFSAGYVVAANRTTGFFADLQAHGKTFTVKTGTAGTALTIINESGNIAVVGDIGVAGTLTVSGQTTIIGGLNAHGFLSVSGATVLAATFVGTTMTVSGATVLKGLLSANVINATSLSVGGSVFISGTLSVTGAVYAGNGVTTTGLSVNGGAIVAGTGFIGGTFTAVGQAVFGDALIAQNMPGSFANDAAAAAAGIAIGRFYRNGSVLMIRVT